VRAPGRAHGRSRARSPNIGKSPLWGSTSCCRRCSARRPLESSHAIDC
jgi:hypothetical protein